MPWQNNSGGGGPWGSGGGSNNNNNNPWGQGPNRSGGNGQGGGSGGQEPDLEELVRRFQDWLRGGKGGGSGTSGGKGGGFGGGLIGLVLIGGLLIAVLFASIYQVSPAQAGVVLRFGEYSRTTGAGLQFKLPYPIETVELVDVTNIRSITVGTTAQKELMVTRDENIAAVAFTVQWQVDPTRVNDFLFNVRNPDGMVRSVSESAMREVVGTSDLLPLIGEGRNLAAQRAREIIQATVDEYGAGVQIVTLNLQEVEAPPEVIAAFQDVIQAGQDAQAVQQQATGYANTVVPTARGNALRLLEEARAYRDQVVAEAEGQADRFNAIYAEYNQAPDVTRQRMFLETMERVLGRSELIILDQSGNGAVPYLPLDRLGQERGPVSGAAGSGQGG